RFLDALRQARSWVRLCTFSQALDETPPAGRIYLPDCSYREMTEWTLPTPKLTAFQHLMHTLEHDSRLPDIKRFFRGGYCRNFRVKYPEAQEMYGRMMQISRRIQDEDRESRTGDRELQVGRRQSNDSGEQLSNQLSGGNSFLDPQSAMLDPLVLARRELY